MTLASWVPASAFDQAGASAAVPSTPARSTPTGGDIVAILEERLIAARSEEDRLSKTIEQLDGELARLQSVRSEAVVALAKSNDELRTTRQTKNRYAIALLDTIAAEYVGGPRQTEGLLPRPGQEVAAFVEESLADAAAGHLTTRLRQAETDERALEKKISIATTNLATTDARIADAGRQRTQRNQEQAVVIAKVAELKRNVSRQGAVTVLPGVDIPVIVLDAHLRASRRVATSDPTCRVAWWILAAIGAIESNNARGRQIDLDGNVAPIVGLVLDGTNGTAAIADTDQGRFDQDTVWDHAVGPMQFIPSTWATWGGDGNGDGNADPNNIYDASVAAARYLCASRGDHPIDTALGLAQAAFAYNHSMSYVAHVLSLAGEYQKADLTPSREVTIAVAGDFGPQADGLVERLRLSGWDPAVIGIGDVEKLLRRRDEVPVSLRGTVLVIAGTSDQAGLVRVADIAASATAGLRTIVVAPSDTVPPLADDHARSLWHVAVAAIPAPWHAAPTDPQSTDVLIASWLDGVAGLLG